MAGKANGISGGKDFFSESEKALKEGMKTLQNIINQSTSAIDETITFTPKVKVDQKDIKLAMKDFNRILANEYNKIQKTDLAVNPRPLSKVDAQNFASAYKGVLKLQQQFGKEFQDEYGNVLKDYEKVFKNLGTYINMGSNAKNLEKEANDFAKTLTEAIGSQYENAASYAIERAEKESIASQKRIAKEEKKIAEKQAIEKLRTSVSSEDSRKKEMQKTQKEMGQMQTTMTGVEKASTNVQQSIVRDQNIIQKEIDETNVSIEKQKQILKDIERQNNNNEIRGSKLKNDPYEYFGFTDKTKPIYDTAKLRDASNRLNKFDPTLKKRNDFEAKIKELFDIIEKDFISEYGINQGYNSLDDYIKNRSDLKYLQKLSKNGIKEERTKDIESALRRAVLDLQSDGRMTSSLIGSNSVYSINIIEEIEKAEVEVGETRQRLFDEEQAQLHILNELQSKRLKLLEEISKAGKESSLSRQTTKSYTDKAADQIKDVQQQIEQTKKGIDIVDDKGIFKKFLLGENGDIKSATQLSSEIQSEIDKVTRKFGRDYTDKGIIHTDEEYIKKLEQTFRKVRASHAFGLFNPNTMRDDIKHYYDEWRKNNNSWLQSSDRLSDDASAHYDNLISLQAQLNAMQKNGGKDYVKYLEEAQEKHNQIYAAQQRNATFKEEDFDTLEISQEEANKRAEGLRKEQKALEELTTSIREYIEANKEFDFEGSPLYHDRNAISGLETMAKMLDREASKFENYTRNKRAAEASIFSEATDKMLTRKSGATKEIEEEWEKLETAILETGIKGSDAIEEFKKKTKELGFEFDESALKWQKVGSLPNEGKAAIRIDEQNLSKQIEWLKELQKITAEYDELNGKASDPDYIMSEKESKRLDEINEKYQKFYETLKQYESIRVHLKNGESYSITEVNDPNEWNTKKNSIKNIEFELKAVSSQEDEVEQGFRETGNAGVETGQKIARSQDEIRKEIEETNRVIKIQEDWLKHLAILNKDFSTSGKGQANEQLRNATKRVVSHRMHPEEYAHIAYSEEMAEYVWYKAYQEAQRQGSSPRILTQNKIDVSDYDFNLIDEKLRKELQTHMEILEESKNKINKLNAELADAIANPLNNVGQPTVSSPTLSKSVEAFNAWHKRMQDFQFSDNMSPWIPMDGGKAEKGAYNNVKKELNTLADEVLRLQKEYNEFDSTRPIRELEKLDEELRDAEIRFAGTYAAANQFFDEALDKPGKNGGASKKVQDLFGYIMGGNSFDENGAWGRNSKILETKAKSLEEHIQQIFASLGINQISSKNLFYWIEENGTNAEKEILKVNEGIEEFRKVLRGLSTTSGGAFNFAENLGLDTVTFEKEEQALQGVSEAGVTAGEQIAEGMKEAREEAEKTKKVIADILVYRGTNGDNPITSNASGATFWSSKKENARLYGTNTDDKSLFSALISMDNAFEIDAKGAKYGHITYLGEGADEASKKILELTQKAEECKKELIELQSADESDSRAMQRASEVALEYQQALKGIKDISEDLNNPYGTHSTDWYGEYAKNHGYDGVHFKNVRDTPDAYTEDVEPSDVYITFQKEQLKNIQLLERANHALADAQQEVKNSISDGTPDLLSGDDAIVQYIDGLEKLEKQSDETREAIQRAIEQTRDAESAGSSLDLLTTLRDENIIPEDITGNLDKVLEKIRTLGLSADDLKKAIKLLKGDTANFSWINGKGLDQTDKINSLIKLLRAYGLQVKEIENSDAFNTEITTQTKAQTEAAKQTAEATKEAAKGIEKEGDAADKAAKKKGRFSRANREAAASARETTISAGEASEGIDEEGDSAQKATDKIKGYIRNRSGDVASGNYNYTQALNKVLNKSVTHSVDDNGNDVVSERTYINFDKLSKLIIELDGKILDYQNKINKATAEEASYLRNNQLQLEEERRIYEKILDDAIQDPNEVISEFQREVLNQQRGINEAMVLNNQLYEDAKKRRKGQEYLDKQQIKDREALLKREEKEALETDRQRVAAYNEEYKIREKLKELETKKNQLREQELQNRINSKYEEQKRIYKDICDLNIKIVELQKDPEGNRNQLDLLKKRKDSLKQQLVSQNALIKNELIAQGKYVSYQDIMANLSETRFENEQKIQSIMASQFDSNRQKQKTNEVEEQRRLYQKICDLNLEIVKLQKDSSGNKKQIETAIKQRDLLKQQLDYQEAIIENRLRGEGMYVSDDQIGKVLMSNVSDIQTAMEQKMQSVMAAYSDSIDKNKTLENEKNINKLYDEEIKNIKRIRALKTANSKIDDNTKDLVKQEERRQNLEEINKLEQKNLSIEEQRKKLLTQIPEIINNVNRYKAIYSLTDDQVEEITNAQIANYVEKLEKAQELAVEKAYEIRFANNIYDKGQASAAESARRSSVIDAGISNADTAKNYVELNKHLLEYIQLKQKAKDVTEKGGALTKKEQNTLDSLEAEFKDAAQATGRYSINIEDNEKSVKKLIKAQLELKGVLDDLDNGNTNGILNKLSSDTYDNIFTKYKSYINMDQNKFTGRVRNELVELQNILNRIKEEGLNIVKKKDIQDLNRINQLVESIDKNKILSQYKAVEQSRVKSLQEQIRAFENNNTAMGGEFRRRFNALWEDLELAQTKKEVDQLKGRFADLKGEVERAGKTGNSVWNSFTKQLKSANGQFLRMYFSWMDWVRYIKTVVSTVRELDTALIDLKKTTSMNSNELEEFYHDSTEIAKATGVTTQEIISQAAAWSRLGYSSKEAAEGMAELSSKFAKISPGTSVDDATDYLVSTMKAFHIDVADVEREIMDVINRVGNKMATTNQEIGEMLKRSSAAMAEANNTLAETIALESAAVQITRNAETTGTAFRTISMRIRGFDEETEELSADLENLSGDIADLTKTAKTPGGISLFTDSTKTTYKSIYQILKEIAAIYHDLDDKTQAALLEKLAGKRGGQVLAGKRNCLNVQKCA